MTAPYRIPFNHDPDWDKVGGGCWDDPVWPFHGYYAYDFGFPEGHKIRAARSGTVVTTVSGLKKGEDLANFPGGNFVYIQHFDGTVASYAHLLTGRVFVSEDEWVNQGQIIAEAGNTGASDGSHLHFQVMLFGSSAKDYGPSIPVLFEDAAHDSWRPKSGDTVKSNNTVLRQENWRWCSKCHGLFFAGGTVSQAPVGNCPAGGAHDSSQSGCYVLALSPTLSMLPIKTQGKWNWCKKCSGLFYGGNPGSKCSAGGEHDKSGSGEYFVSLSAGFNVGQEGWRWCDKCEGLFLGAAGSRCPAGGPHTAAGSGHYTLHQVDELNLAQGDWRLCRKCQGLFFGLNTGSVCPKDKQPHDGSQSQYYALLMEPAPVAGQKGWRWCRKCQGAFFSENAGSVCPAGGSHSQDGSGKYLLYLNALKAPAQQGWRWCRKCQGLFLNNGSPAVCPAGGPHTESGSGQYAVGWVPPA